MSAPFIVTYGPVSQRWSLWMRTPRRLIGWYDTQAEAINDAYHKYTS